jgi:DNA-binding CsgD family transcriptional regulator
MDYDLLKQVLTTLLSPLECSSLDLWTSRWAPNLKTLLGADSVIVGLPIGKRLIFSSEDFSANVLSDFSTRVQPLAQRFSTVERAAMLGVYTRAMLWRPHLTEYHESDYYNDYVLPNRFFDLIGLASRINKRDDINSLAVLMAHHLTPTGTRFGSHDVRILRLLLPAFNTGVWTFLRFAHQRGNLPQTLDLLSDGLLVCDSSARVLHANNALLRMMSQDPEGERLLDASREAARRLIRQLQSAEGDDHSISCVLEIATSRAVYRMRGTLMKTEPFGAGATVMVAAERVTPELPTEESLRERYGLSRKEARVALYLAQGNSNEMIAARLSISPHTARHHTERVLMKLGAISRAEVGARVLGPILTLSQAASKAGKKKKLQIKRPEGLP